MKYMDWAVLICPWAFFAMLGLSAIWTQLSILTEVLRDIRDELRSKRI